MLQKFAEELLAKRQHLAERDEMQRLVLRSNLLKVCRASAFLFGDNLFYATLLKESHLFIERMYLPATG
jgi:hypothetical protein